MIKRFDVAISFAGEDRAIAQRLAEYLTRQSVRVFYDTEEQANLLGEELTEYLVDVYKNQASYCLIVVSNNYRIKRWARLELRAALSRAWEQPDSGYILPVRLDETELPGLLPTIGYLSIPACGSVEEVGATIAKKVGGTARFNALVRAADQHFRKGEFARAAELLSAEGTYVHIRENYTALRLLTDALMHENKYHRAIFVFEDLISQFPSDPEAYFLLGICHCRLRQYSNAVPILEKAVALGPANASASLDLTRARYMARVYRFLSLFRILSRSSNSK